MNREYAPGLPSVSVVIPTLGRPEMLREQIEAVLGQDYRGALEVVVARNGPEDGTGAVIRALSGGPRAVRLVEATARQNISYARNCALAAAQGEVIACCDDDDRADPGWVTALVAALGAHDVVGGRFADHPDSPEELKRLRSTARRNHLTELCGVKYAMGGNLGIWRDRLELLQGWDEQWHPAGEDVDLTWRAHLAGFSLGFAPEAVVAFRVRGTGSAQLRQTYRYARTNVRLQRAYAGLLTESPRWRDELRRLVDLVRSFPYRRPWQRRAEVRAWRMRATIARGRWRGMLDRSVPTVRIPPRGAQPGSA